MLGTVMVTETWYEQELDRMRVGLQGLHAMGRVGRQTLGIKTRDAIPKGRLSTLRRCRDLANDFKPIKRDESVKRQVKVTGGFSRQDHSVMLPLVWWAQLPAEPTTRRSKTIGGNRYNMSARTPVPTPEAMDAVRAHRDRFDHCEVWWVPQEVLVEPIPEPDPVVVGAITVPARGSGRHADHYFELYRWIDETVEDAYWFREAY